MYLQSCLFMFMVLQYGESFGIPPVEDIYSRINAYGSHNVLNASNVVHTTYKEHRSGYHAPSSLDWRQYEVIRKIKDQYTCGACWAFTVTAAIESHIMIHLGNAETLSEQFLIDCSDVSKGCNSNSLLKVFGNIVTNLGGVLRNRDYFPYSSERLRCRWDGKRQVTQHDYEVISHNNTEPILPESDKGNSNAQPIPVVGLRRVQQNEEIMKEYVYRHGPLAAAINSDSMAKYGNGKNYIDEPSDEDCNPRTLNHTVLIVGYSTYVNERTKKSTPYWIIKNSWGDSWGDRGFYYLVRGRNACGIASDVSFPYVN